MNADSVGAYIGQLRHWLKASGEPLLRSAFPEAVPAWLNELAIAERMLERSDALPIAFLGPSQQGKSSLINALLGENILAVGGAVGACTCVITSVHYQQGPGYRAEIDFIELAEWRKELHGIQDAIFAATSAEDSAEDDAELQSQRNAAIEKYEAVYRGRSQQDVGQILKAPDLELPSEILAATNGRASVRIQQNNAQTFRNEVRRYLVGRDQSPDAQFWPLIREVRIYGDFPVLANGTSLVDLPGLNDPNPAREQITKRYLEQSRYIWLICNSQTGIDRVFADLLRDNGFFFRLFLEGRLGAFSVVTTRIDETNLDEVITQMGQNPADFDGDFGPVLDYRRGVIARHVTNSLVSIAEDIVRSAGEAPEHRSAFLKRVVTIPVFSVATAAYLKAVGKMPLFQGIQLSTGETHVPKLVEHLHSITKAESYRSQVEASHRRMVMLNAQVYRFFLDLVEQIELDGDDARGEWARLKATASAAAERGRTTLREVEIRGDVALQERCSDFDRQLAQVDTRAQQSLQSVFSSWSAMNWRTLQAAVRRNGEWYSSSLRRDYNLSRDIAGAYTGLIPFIWDDFFGKGLTDLTDTVSAQTEDGVQDVGRSIIGALSMLRHQPDGMAAAIEKGIATASEVMPLRVAQVTADLQAQIQRTRQSLSTGLLETTASLMQPAFEMAANDTGGRGVKLRMLAILRQHAESHAPELFIGMRQELSEGVAVLQGSMKPQLKSIVTSGEQTIGRFQQNLTSYEFVTPELREEIKVALQTLPRLQEIPA